jgi:hypothetical protein
VAELVLHLTIDASELLADLERLEEGELSLPTVSAVHVFAGARRLDDIPIFLGG